VSTKLTELVWGSGMSKPAIVFVVLLSATVVFFGRWHHRYNYCRYIGGGRLVCALTVFP
jgi:hypothetical protein